MPIAVVVSHFHTRKGQRVEWQHPHDFDSEGVEFKSIASGFHASEEDFVFFRHGELFALACFHKLPTDSAAERDVRMRSVAAFAVELTVLQHPALAPRLLEHARRLNADPDATAPLLELLAPPPAPSFGQRLMDGLSGASPHRAPADGGTRPQLVPLAKQLGPRMFTLWKALLLRRRVMLYATPPVGRLCERALAAYALQQVAADGGGGAEATCELLLYVGLNDEADLAARTRFAPASGPAERGGFVACTTDALFAHKPELWDVWVDEARGQEEGLKVSPFDLRGLALTAHDEYRWSTGLRGVLEQAEREAFPRNASDTPVSRYFAEQAATLRHGLDALVEEGVAEVVPKHFKRLGLGDGDATFLRNYATLRGLRLSVKTPRFRCC